MNRISSYFQPEKNVLFLTLLLCTTARAQLNVNFTVDKTGGCSPLTVSFTNRTTGASVNAIYKWDFGNGNTSTLTNAGAVFTDEKDYTVTLTVQDGNVTASKTATISVYKKPVVDFSASVIKGCIALPVTFTGKAQAGSGYISGYYWDFGDGSTQQTSASSVVHSYTQVQRSTVNVTVTNNYGCYSTLTKKDMIQTLPALTAAFSADKKVLCHETDPVQFTNASNGPGTLSYVWDFGDGHGATQKDPQYAFNKKGIYTVKLTVNSSEGCTNTITQTNYLNVASYSSDFDFPTPVCKGAYITFTSKSSPAPNNTMWKVNDNQTYYNGSSYMSYPFYTPGTYAVKLVNTFGTCFDSVTKQVQVNDVPNLQGFVANYSAPCGAPATVQFADTTPSVVKWEWDFNNIDYSNPVFTSTVQKPSYTYANDGSYNVLLKVTNSAGCTATTNKIMQVSKPSAFINYTSTSSPFGLSACGPITIIFTASGSQSFASYKWNFGDGSTSTNTSPSHTFSNPGSYNVTLNYVTTDGCSGSTLFYSTVNVYSKPSADFSTAQTAACGNTPVTFTINWKSAFSSWYFDFGDGHASYWANSHIYEQSGLYSVKLISWNGACSDTIIKTNYVKATPVLPKITGYTHTCDGTRGELTFNQASPGATGWVWDFRDGTTLSLTTDQPTIKHTYTKSGNYTVLLKATNGQCNAYDSIYVVVTLKQSPVLNATKTEICAGEPLQTTITNLERNYARPLTSSATDYSFYKAEYGDGSAFTGYVSSSVPYTSPVLNELARGKQSIRIILQSYGLGCYDTTTYVPIKIKGASAGFQVIADRVCFTDPVVLKDTSVSDGSTIQKWEWNFGDGQTGTQGGTVSHTYSNPGYYYVTLKVTDASGCTAATSFYSTMVNVNGPKAAFSTSGTNVPLATTVYFYNNTNNYNIYGTIYKWQVNGADFSTNYNPSYTFNQPGTYTVTLTATNPASGCTSTATQTIVVRNFNAAFSVAASAITNNNCPPVLVRLSNTSQNYTSIKWDFGDGNTLDNVNYPSHIYEKAGKYIITLYVYGANGLKGTFIDSVIINQPEAVIQSNAKEACIGDAVTLNAVARNTGTYVWDFGDGSIVSGTDTFAIHQYYTPGSYSPALIMKQSANGCTGATQLADKVNIRPNPIVVITPAAPFICNGASVQLQASGGITYEWTPAAGLSDAAIANPVAAPVQTGSYTVKVTDNMGCKNTGNVTITVIQPVHVSLTGKPEICQGESINMNASGAEVYKWIDNTTGLNNIDIPNPVATPQVTTTYTITGSDAHACFTDTASVTIQVRPLPTVNAGADAEPWPGDPAQLQATGSPDVISWNWTPATYLSCINCAAPVCKPLVTTEYTITVKNQYGCAATDTMLVKMLCNENRVRIPNGFTPNGDGVNDIFMIKGISIVKHLVIFNRWGQKVFERSNFIAGDRSQCWNGAFKGYDAEAGTYVYLAELDCPDGGTFVRKGTLTLMR